LPENPYSLLYSLALLEKETARIEAFSDGVFAIAITLLVLDLHVPQLQKSITGHQLIVYLSAQWPSYLSLCISFFSIYIIWINHHKIFKQIYKRNTAIMFANGLLLFLVTVVSYATGLLSSFLTSGAIHAVVAIYTGLFVLINLSFNMLWYTASRHKELLRPQLTPTLIHSITKTYLRGLPVHTIAFILAFFFPVLSIILCVVLWIFWAFTSQKVHLSNE
jgi:uncharacterized membrane protein